MIIGTFEVFFRVFRWLSYRAQRRSEWLVVVQDFSARAADRHAYIPASCIEGPDGAPFRVRSLPGWSGENPRYRAFGRMRRHVFAAQPAAMIPGYVEVLPDRSAAARRAAEITLEVQDGRWSPPVDRELAP